MIYNERLTRTGDRASVLEYLASLKASKPELTVLGVGASANPWDRNFLTHVVDIDNWGIPVPHFLGNISDRVVWDEVLEHVKVHGKFDFLTCTHTLEDISAAVMVCNMFPRIAKEGYIAIPSKYSELSHPEAEQWLGHIHHRWVYDMVGTTFVGYPKQPFLEHMANITEWAKNNPREGRDELQFFWKDTFTLNPVHNDLLGPTNSDVINYYSALTL